MKKGIFFDLYGTIIDIETDEYDPWAYSVLCQYLTYHEINITPDELKNAYFGETERHFKQSAEIYPELDVYEIFYKIMHKYGKNKYPKGTIIDAAMLFRSLTRRRFGIFPSSYDVLGHLSQKYKMAIISDAQWVFAEPEMAILGLDRHFKVRILSSRFGFKKPDVRLFELAMAKLGTRPEESIYIGDNPCKDIVGAKKTGMKSILFRSECLKYDDLEADGHFYDYSELEKTLYEIF